MKYQRIPEIVEAVQWFKLGDHKDVYLNSMHHNRTHIINEQTIYPGDWIVTDSSGLHVLSDEEFKKIYRPVE